MGTGVQQDNLPSFYTGIERKAWEDNLVNRRKPRMYATTDLSPSKPTDITLDFCFWLSRNFDGLVEAINAGTLHSFSTW